MLTNRNCKNIQHGADFAKTFLGQQCCHAVKVFLTLETEEEKGGVVQQSTNGDVQVGPVSLWVRTFTKACRERYSNQYLNSKKRGWESQQIKMD